MGALPKAPGPGAVHWAQCTAPMHGCFSSGVPNVRLSFRFLLIASVKRNLKESRPLGTPELKQPCIGAVHWAQCTLVRAQWWPPRRSNVPCFSPWLIHCSAHVDPRWPNAPPLSARSWRTRTRECGIAEPPRRPRGIEERDARPTLREAPRPVVLDRISARIKLARDDLHLAV